LGQGDAGPIQTVVDFYRDRPGLVAGLVDAASVTVGAGVSCAVLMSASVSCWGADLGTGFGGGAGSANDRAHGIPGLVGVKQVSIGEGHACALFIAGTMKCWGSNSQGELGTGDNLSSPTPVAVAGLSGVTSISAGWHSTCAVLADQTVNCWGINYNSMLGTGSTAGSSNNPAAVIGVAGARDVAVTDGSVCALLVSGAIACWGQNSEGQLGQNGTTSYAVTSPVLVANVDNADSLSGSGNRYCARRADGGIWCWGDLAEPARRAPAPIGLASVSSLSPACAVDTSARAWCWGGNGHGELGNGTRWQQGANWVPQQVLFS